jgi:signal transduction histidine kinase
VLTQYFERSETRRRQAAMERVERTIQSRGDALSRSMARFCAHDYIVDRTLAQLRRGDLPPASRDEIATALASARNALGLDTLALVREPGDVLASVHYPARAGSRDDDTWAIARRAPPGGAVRTVRSVRVAGPNDARNLLVLEAVCVARLDTVAIAVAGGEALDERIAADAHEEGLSIQIVPGDATTDRNASHAVSARVLTLRGAPGATASIVVRTSDVQLRDALADLNRLTLIAALFAGILAILLAALLAPPLARPISEVAEAADKIALGTRSVQIDPGRTGGEAGKLVRAFNHMARELEVAAQRARRAERIAAWRDIARQMAHEIKNPLTPIQMAVENLRKAHERSLPDFEQFFDEETRIVLEEVARLRRLVENFSRFARAPRPRLEQVSIEDVVGHVVGLHANSDKVEVTGEAEAGLPEVRADREQLTQVLINLVGNAAFAAEERATKHPDKGPAAVHVSAHKVDATHVSIAVDDNGAGIDPAVMERLFEPYVTTKHGRGGTGLGLAIAYRIVHDHGGSITADSSGEGTRFEVLLPLSGPSTVDATLDSERDLRSG